MKKITMISTMAILLTGIVACRQASPHSTMTVQTDSVHLKIETAGNVVFSRDEDFIDAISENGFLKYDKNGKTLIAEGDGKGNIIYEVNGGEKTTTPDDTERQFIRSVVREIMRQKKNQKK
ncbi:hypothetical protein [Hufsiella ginkgonis]|uniref:Uncharacterized protein n=1 Tax=Hufsiella ginkgonis TaxID=2695274 RepID=A0A7K1XW33_9SPHI|nr:hypothetical protein [Hufsiella ginkgonis]MXV15180.1 hypothetical protein [Hufsiella ginkgonis]